MDQKLLTSVVNKNKKLELRNNSKLACAVYEDSDANLKYYIRYRRLCKNQKEA